MQIIAKLNTKSLADFPARARRQLAKAVRKAAFECKYNAQLRVPVDTGAAKNSIYVVASDINGYSEAMGNAASANAAAEMFGDEEKVEDDLTAKIVVGAMYGRHLEEGTAHMAPRPFLLPSLEDVLGPFAKACDRAMKDA